MPEADPVEADPMRRARSGRAGRRGSTRGRSGRRPDRRSSSRGRECRPPPRGKQHLLRTAVPTNRRKLPCGRLRDRRRGLGRVRARGATVRGPGRDRRLLEAGGPDTEAALHVPAMFPLASSPPGLGPAGRARARPGGPAAVSAARQGDRRLELDQRDDLPARQPADYDDWAAGGATGWSYDEVLPYFKRSEDNERGEDEFHGVGGPLAVSDGRSMSP